MIRRILLCSFQKNYGAVNPQQSDHHSFSPIQIPAKPHRVFAQLGAQDDRMAALEGIIQSHGQKVDLTARIRGILRSYPEGSAVIKEL